MNALLALVLTAADPAGSTAKIGVALGTVELKPAAAPEYAAAAAGAAVENDVWVRTGADGRAALDFADGTELRLDQNTELHVQGPRKVVLKAGVVYARIAQKPDLFVLETKFAPMETSGGLFEVKFIHRDPNSPEFKKVSRTVTEIMTMEGKINVKSRKYAQIVTAGYHCDMVDSQLNTPDPNPNPMIMTAWVNPILAARGAAAGAEMQLRADTYMSRLGQTEQNDPCEAALRGLGASAVPALLDYFKFPATTGDAPRRRAAARVLADVCPPSSADALLKLLKEADAEVKASGVKGLQRLTGKDHGADEKAWAETIKGVRQ
ncbi:MAG TPA: FecR family protein [Planctomycetota bacterium]|nr:FecR family protein [Planctomycetota bacterium]